jgi:hypothetical protein
VKSEESSYFKKIATKKFPLLRALALLLPKPTEAKVFWFFFSKKNRLLALLDSPSTNHALNSLLI